MVSFFIVIIGIYCLFQILPAVIAIIGAPIVLGIEALNRPMTPEEVEAYERKAAEAERKKKARQKRDDRFAIGLLIFVAVLTGYLAFTGQL